MSQLDPAKAGNFVFDDLNGDGIRDSEERGVGNVVVQLQTPDGTVVATQTTTNQGFYLFEDVPPGEYQIAFTAPDGFLFTAKDQGTDDRFDSDVDPTSGVTDVFTLEPGQRNYRFDAGLIPDLEVDPAKAGNFVFEDLNGDGIRDSEEPGVGSVTVQLQTPDGTVVATQTTTKQGFYLFEDVPPGAYQIAFIAPDGFMFTAKDQGTDDRFDSDADPTSGITDVFTLASGEKTFKYDAGLIPELEPDPAKVGNFVFEDGDGDGIRDEDEPGVGSVTVELQTPDGTVVATQTTTKQGFYLFEDVPPGEYQIAFKAPEGFTFTAKDQGPDDRFDSDADPTSGVTDVFTLAEGERIFRVDAGLIPALEPTASLGDKVFLDADRDGVQDAGEVGVAGVTVELTGAGEDGEFGTADDITDSTITGANGMYAFTDLAAGDYKVTFSDLPAGFEFTTQNAGNDDGADSDADPINGMTQVVTLNPGDANLTLDAGIVEKLGTIGDRVWFDDDGDGVQDASEGGINGVTVKLINKDTNELVATETTTGDGNYRFENVVQGNYTVMVDEATLPENILVQTGDPDAALDNMSMLSLPAGGENLQQDFGYRRAKHVLIEAEDMHLCGYEVEHLGNDIASGGKAIKLNWYDGYASTHFTGHSGYYQVDVAYFDENDGKSMGKLKIGGETIDTWTFDQHLGSRFATADNRVVRTVSESVYIQQGEQIKLAGWFDHYEYARFDSIKFTEVEAPKHFLYEAEDMHLRGYYVEHVGDDIASGGEVIKLSSHRGHASVDFTGPTGKYDILVGYYDENDGQSTANVKVGGDIVDAWTFDELTGSRFASEDNFVERKIEDVHIDAGERIKLSGWFDHYEYARFDYIKVVAADDAGRLGAGNNAAPSDIDPLANDDPMAFANAGATGLPTNEASFI